jgi:coenzyme F420-reducing hydrogenase beta subunit
MIKINKAADCCGCTACASICTHDAISMEPDTLGFLYPKIDVNKCVNCGLCEKVCQFNDDYDHSDNFPEPIAFAVRHKDINEVMKSRSGAAFVAISDYILDQGGVVYGAGYKDHFRVVHKRATTREERDEFRGSKYVQSDLTDVFQQVKEDLRNGLLVLFSGTPCQTSGIKAYIGNKLRENLYLVDIVCHGVPSPYIWNDYLLNIENDNKEKIVDVNFRNKTLYGWKDHKETYKLESGKLVISTQFTDLFYKHIIFRHSCGVCHFANLIRPSDITLADFWGYENNIPDMNVDDKGISLVLLNTEKGKDIFKAVSCKFDEKKVNIKDCLQPNLQHASLVHSRRMKLEKDYVKKGFLYVLSYDYDKVSLLRSVFRKIKRRFIR